MNPDLERLIALEATQREIDRLAEEVAALPRRVAAIEEKLAATKSRGEKAKSAIAAAQGERRKLESEIQVLQQKVSKYRDQQFEVKTNEQYRALLQEIEFAAQEIRRHEDKILEGMLRVETHEKELKAAEAELKAENAEIEKEKTETRARTAEDEQQLAELKARRQELRGGISAEALRYYDRVAKLRHTAIAEVREQKCTACHVLLRPQTYNEVRTNQKIIACDSCDRMLFYDPTQEPAAPPAKKGRGKREAECAWLYLSDGEQGAVFVALANAKGSCSKRVFDAATGRTLEVDVQPDSVFRDAFAGELERGVAVQLEEQPDLEYACDEQLPEEVLRQLQHQVQGQENAATEAPARN